MDFVGLRWLMWYQVRRKSERFLVRWSSLRESLSGQHRMCFGVVILDTSLILTDIYGRWLGIPISGPALKMK